MPESADTTDVTTVLVIESDPDFANVIKALVERVTDDEPYRVLIAEDLAHGLPLVAEKDVGCVLIDPDAPGGGLADSLAQFRAVDKTTPVIVLSGHSDYEEQSRLAERQGAERYLVKGYIDRDTLTRAIEDAVSVGLGRMRRPLPSSAGIVSEVYSSETLQVASETILALVRRFGIPLVAITVSHRERTLGDEGMEALGRILASSVRRSDLVGRTARDEYSILLAGASDAAEALGRTRDAIRSDPILRDDADGIRYGLATLDPDRPQTLDALIKAARRNGRLDGLQ